MADEKQYEPTQSRLEKAKREGDVAKSQEAGNVAAFAAGLFATAASVMPIAAGARAVLGASVQGRIDAAALAATFAWALLPTVAAACAGVACGVLQTGGLRFVAVTIKRERLSPAENLKRMLSREALVTAARATIAFLCAGAALVPACVALFGVALRGAGVQAVAQAAWNGALRAAAIACAVGAVFAAADYGLQLRRWRARLRMSSEELRRDQKEQDGDPLARGRRRSLHRRISRGSLRRVKDAAFIVTNPTHIAIALEYRPPDVAVPRVIVRAADETATRVRELASVYAIPIVENVPLARVLYAAAEPGQYVPQETYLALAEIVAALVKGGRL